MNQVNAVLYESDTKQRYENETGKKARWRGKLTKAFKEWRKINANTHRSQQSNRIPGNQDKQKIKKIMKREKTTKEKIKKNVRFTSTYQDWWTEHPCLNEDEEGKMIFGRGNRKFLNIVKKYETPHTLGHFEKHLGRKVFVLEKYQISKRTADKALQELAELQRKGIESYNNCPDIFRLLSVLRKLFNRNLAGKYNTTRTGKSSAYSSKNSLLSEAVSLAKKIDLPFFKWGLGIDLETVCYEVVVYFQIGDQQISFHTNQITKGPEFHEGWNGIMNEVFPFSQKQIRKLMKEHNIDVAGLNSFEFRETEENYRDYSSYISEPRPRRSRRNYYGGYRRGGGWDDDEFDDYDFDEFEDYDDDEEDYLW